MPTGNTVTITGTSAASPTSSVSANVTITSPVVTVTITQAASPLAAGSAETIIANVVNDSLKDGVSWSVSCTNSISGAGCGTFNPTTSSGNTPQTSYTAPASVPSGGVDVTISATSIANGITTGTANVTILPNANLGLLNGPYALFLSGQNASGFYTIVGSVTADGLGNITVGAEDINSLNFACSPSSNLSPVTGTYSVGSDGRGTMTLQTGNSACFGNAGVQTLSFTVVGAPGTSVVRALVTEFDNATASGTLDLQTLSATISGNYAFTMAGVDLFATSASGAIAADVGGVFVASAGTVTSGFQDINDQGTGVVSKKQSMVAGGTYTAPDPTTGRGTITFGPNSGQFMYVYYIVNSGRITLLSYDVNNDLVVGGSAYSQGTGTFAAQNAFTLSGTDASQVAAQSSRRRRSFRRERHHAQRRSDRRERQRPADNQRHPDGNFLRALQRPRHANAHCRNSAYDANRIRVICVLSDGEQAAYSCSTSTQTSPALALLIRKARGSAPVHLAATTP